MKLEEMIDIGVLKSIKNPTGEQYEIHMHQPELTFMGVEDQPDYGVLDLFMYPGKRLVELRSLKKYLQQYRMVVISYERFADTVFKHLMEVYEPAYLRLVLSLNPRGGISSTITIDSKVREEAKAQKES
ncbi:MAG: 7-cyano-7-deazaguanine reductase [Nanoarchaeota archaeon]|nr:7-cyano-7-deazaguanine reductase [Nanoarchaeota archaeon]